MTCRLWHLSPTTFATRSKASSLALPEMLKLEPFCFVTFSFPPRVSFAPRACLDGRIHRPEATPRGIHQKINDRETKIRKCTANEHRLSKTGQCSLDFPPEKRFFLHPFIRGHRQKCFAVSFFYFVCVPRLTALHH